MNQIGGLQNLKESMLMYGTWKF